MKRNSNARMKSAYTGRQVAITCALFVLCSALVCFADASTAAAQGAASPQAAILKPAPPAQALDQDTSKRLVGISPSLTLTLNGNRNVVANFSQNPTINYKIALSAFPEGSGFVSGAGTFATGSSRNVTASPARGYTFANWTENGNIVSTSPGYTFTLSGNRNLVANFTPIQINYTTSVGVSPKGSGAVSGAGTDAANASRTVTATPSSGYVFTNWTENGAVVSSLPSYTFTLTGNRNLIAHFTTAVAANPTSKCVEGEKTAPDGTCVVDVRFFAQDSITLEAAKNLAAKNGWALARAEEVQAAWNKKALDIFSYGMLEDGRFAVPVQTDHAPTFKAGANIGVTGGNQGFFYIPASASAAARRGVANASPAPPDMIDLGESPLSSAEMNEVMTWISVRVAALRVPFCWRQSYGNTAGEPYTCRPGLERIGLLCYPPCKPGFHHSTANLCTTDCPAGFTDIGAFCQKPAPYGRGAGYGAYIQCLPPPPGGGARRFCAPDPNARAKNCEKDNGAGNCEEWGLLFYPKCKPGFHNVGANICSPDCPADWADTGTGCTKPVYGVGAGEGLALGVCRPGLEKDPAGALCYPTCKKDYHMVGPVCWQNCPAQQPADCGAGCATKQGDCASAVANMVIAPIVAAISLATFGTEGEIAAGAAHGAQLATTAAIEAERIATVAARLKQSYQVIKGALAAVKGNVAELVGGAENLKKIQDLAKAGGKIYTISSKITKELDLFSKEFADNFEVLTSKEIAAEIDNRFSKDAAYQLKRQWGLSHLTLMLNADGFATASNVIGIASAADITGITGVVAAYMHPICENNTPFPTVHPLYNH